MKAAVLIVVILLLLSARADTTGKKGKTDAARERPVRMKKKSRPWYDIRVEDMIEYDLFGEDDE
jgi:hypothetical protein